MRGRIGIIQIAHPGPDDEGDEYWRTGRGAALLDVYGGLLGLRHVFIGYHKLVHDDGRTPELGFEFAPDDPPPVWGDPDRPPQVHLDVEVADPAATEARLVARGASVLATFDDHRVLADPVGHPFCLYPAARPTAVGRIRRVVFDCLSPRALAAFYAAFLDLPDRVVDEVDLVVLDGAGADLQLAFRRTAHRPPQWPDPRHPAQLHLDLDAGDEGAAAVERALRLGAVPRPNPERPDASVYVDPSGHPFCLGTDGWGTYGPAQVAEYEAWRAREGG